MKTVEELKAEQAAAIAKLEAEHAIASLAPVPPLRVMLVSTGEKAWLTYECATLWQALDVMTAYEPLPFNEYKDSCTRFETEETNAARPETGYNRRGGYKSGPYIAQIDVHGGEGFGPCVQLKFFARLGVDIVAVHCDLRRPGYGPSSWWNYGPSFVRNDRGSKHQRGGHGDSYMRGEFHANGVLSAKADNVTTWGTGCAESFHHEYAFSCDDESGAWDVNARPALEYLALKMHGERASVILSESHVNDRVGGPGKLLEMGDGSLWFHPYSGGNPVCERPAK